MKLLQKAGLRSGDILIVAFILITTIFASVWIYGTSESPSLLVVESVNGKWVYPLNTDTTVEIPGLLGSTRIEIHDGRARFLDSPCPNKTCVTDHGIGSNGEWNACLPNQVIARIASEHDGDLDVMAY